jgi:tryptase
LTKLGLKSDGFVIGEIPVKSIQWILLSSLIVCASCAPESSFNNSVSIEQETAILDGTMISTRTTPASRSVVYIELLKKNGLRQSYCTATLIAKNIVLTAAHCFDSNLIPEVKSFNVVFNTQVVDFGNRVVRPGIASKIHPDYNSLQRHPRLYDHDIAIAMFKGDLPQGYAPVGIDTDTTADYSNTELYVYGYGRLYDYAGTPSDFGSGGGGYLRRGVMRVNANYHQTPDRYFIASTSKNFVCQGDSGGPEFYNKGSILKVVGVNSAAIGDVLPNGKQLCRGVSQATKVAPFAPWIMNEQKKMLNRYQ